MVLDVDVTVDELETGCAKSVDHTRRVYGPNGIEPHSRKFKVEVYRGDTHNSRRIFPGEADEGEGLIPGDLICVIKVKPHRCFHTMESNLLYEVDAIGGAPRLNGDKRILFHVVHLPGGRGATVVTALAIGPALEPESFEQVRP